MSLHETWRTEMYWKTIGGLLIEEFVAVDGNKEQGRRTIDRIIVLDRAIRFIRPKRYWITILIFYAAILYRFKITLN